MPTRQPVAIVGMGCRLPGDVDNPTSYWNLLREGVDAMRDVPEDRWRSQRFYDADTDAPGKTYIKQGGFLTQDLKTFDAGFFGISPREAASLDPQQRLLLEVAWEALEDGGLDVPRLAGQNVGVFVGGFMLDYYTLVNSTENRSVMDTYTASGSGATMLSARLAYTFDFRGPTLSIDTACSSSLVALHYGCLSLWNGECEMALVGGVNYMLNPSLAVALSKARLVSPDWRCKAFDARANGYARGEGAGVVVLKPLSAALAQGDRIYAVIRGTGVNQDGHSEGGITAPSQDAQEALLRVVYTRAGVDPSSVQYVEAHGTGTAVGDRTEAMALGAVLSPGRSSQSEQELLLGSVKTNFGHLEAAAGVAGLMKAALAVHHAKVPPNLHFQTPNPAIPFEALKLRVPTRVEPWPKSNGPRLAGVNSFGYGGTNAHAVLEQAPESSAPRRRARTETLATSATSASAPKARLIPISARSESALRARARQLVGALDAGAGPTAFGDLAYTLSERRSHDSWRLTVLAKGIEGLLEGLERYLAGERPPGIVTGQVKGGSPPRLVWLFSGMGPQWWQMGRQLLSAEPLFRQTVEACHELFAQHGELRLMDELLATQEQSRMGQTHVAQAANFALQAGLAALYRSWGIEPSIIIGHSVGEVSAAYASGALTLEDAAAVAFHRGRVQAKAAGKGGMLAVGLKAEEAEALLEPGVSVAAINGPTAVTLSGEQAVLTRIAQRLEERGVFHRALRVEVPYHSPAMEPLRDELVSALASLKPASPTCTLVSTVTGEPVTGPDLNAAYWYRNVREPVRFARAVAKAVELGGQAFLELGPHPTLASSTSECLEALQKPFPVISTLSRKNHDVSATRTALAELYAIGLEPRWDRFRTEGATQLSLPGYPWQRTPLWHESVASLQERCGRIDEHPLLGRRRDSTLPQWDAELTGSQHAYLAGHRIHGELVLPGAAYLEAALGALKSVYGEGQWVLEDVVFSQALMLESDPLRRIRVALDRRAARFSVLSGEGQLLHAEGTAYRLAAGVGRRGDEKVEPQSFRSSRVAGLASCGPPAELYRRLAARGYEYGAPFQGIAECYSDGQRTLSLIDVAPGVDATLGDYVLHPALLDACFHSVLAPDTDGALYLPVGVRRLLVHAVAQGPLWCEAQARSDAHADLRTVDLKLYDASSGHLLAEVDGLSVKRVGASGETHYAPWLYRFEWRPQALDATARPQRGARYLLVGEASSPELGALATRLQGAGAKVSWSLSDEESLRAAVTQAREAGDALAGVIYGKSLPTRSGEDWPLDAGIEQCVDVLAVIQLLSSAKWSTPPTVSVLVRGSLRVVDGDGVEHPHSGALAGWLRTAINEHPELHFRLIDLDGRPEHDQGEALFHELTSEAREEEVALRAGQRFVRRFVHCAPATLRKADLARVTGDKLPFELAALPGQLGYEFRQLSARAVGPSDVEIEVSHACVEHPPTLAGLTGRVVRKGSEVTALQLGQVVTACTAAGVASHVRLDARAVAPLPRTWSPEKAAGLLPWYVAYRAFTSEAHFKPGQRILVHTDWPELAFACAALLPALGAAAVVIAVEGDELEASCRAMGFHSILPMADPRFVERARELFGSRPCDAVIRLQRQRAPDAATARRAWTRIEALLPQGGAVVDIRVGGERLFNWEIGTVEKELSFAVVGLHPLVSKGATDWTRFVDLLEGPLAGVLRHVQVPEATALESLPTALAQPSAARRAVTFADQTVPVRLVEDRPLFHPDAAYVVTGGLGGFGLATAKWMAERGAKTLVLLGRRAPSPAAQAAIAGLERLGVKVLVGTADVGREGDLTRALAALPGLPTIRGVFHAAGETRMDSFLAALKPSVVREVMRAKVVGAWNVYRELRTQPLEHFVLFSSFAALQGTVSLPCYAAANSFLDSFAEHLRSAGVPALAVNWGAVADVGVLAERSDFRKSSEAQGAVAEPAAQMLEALGLLLSGAVANVAVSHIDLQKFADQYPGLVRSPRFAELFAPIAARREQTRGFAERLRSAPEAGRAALVLEATKALCAKLFGTRPERLQDDVSLKALGLDSLLATQLKTAIERELELPVQVMALLRGPTLSELATLLARQLVTHPPSPAPSPASSPSAPKAGDAAPALDGKSPLEASVSAVQLAAEIRPDAPPDIEKGLHPRTVFLTGATGFLGIHVVDELLRKTDAKVVCLVRAESPAAGLERIFQTAAKYRVKLPRNARIEAVCGDLALPRLGLTEGEFERWAVEADALYHCAALLNFLFDYDAFVPANVQGTQEALRLACLRRTKPFHHVSTTFFLTLSPRSAGLPSPVPEEGSHRLGRSCVTGYAQSKWVAEGLVVEAMRRGLPVTIHRPPLIIGHSQTGASNETDIFSRLLLGLTALGAVQQSDVPLDAAPIDLVARWMVDLSLRHESLGRTFHLTPREPMPLHALAAAMRELGHTIEPLPLEQWLGRMQALLDGPSDNALRALVPFLTRTWEGGRAGLFDLLAQAPRLETGFGSESPDWRAIAKRSFEYLKGR